jgi:hypothetical protein
MVSYADFREFAGSEAPTLFLSQKLHYRFHRVVVADIFPRFNLSG